MKTTPKDRESIVRELAIGTGFPAAELDAAINIESGWHWDALNPKSGAEGLIQIMPFHLREWGVPRGTVRKAKPRQQIEYIARYFRKVGRQWKRPGDTYLAIAAPAAVGAPDSHVIYPIGSDAWTLNHIWRDGPDGPITAGSIRSLLLRRMKRGRGDYGVGLPKPKPKRRVSIPSWAWALGLAVAGLALLDDAQGAEE